MISLEVYKKSIEALRNSINVLEKTKKDSRLDDLLPSLETAVVKNFELSYEMTWKIMKKFLKEVFDIKESEILTRADLFRYAAKKNILEDISLWIEFNKARNLTSYDYSLEKAEEVYTISINFLEEANKVLLRLEEINNGKY